MKKKKEQTLQEILDDGGIEMPTGTLKLSEPFSFDGEAVTELPYDFSKVTGRDGMHVTAELKREGLLSAGPQDQDPNYCAAIFAVAADMDLHDLDRLNVKDLNEASDLAAIFFAWKESRKTAMKSGSSQRS